MIDFKTVKDINIPEGLVQNISINNVVVWEKQTLEDFTLIPFLQFNADMVFDTGVICNQNTRIEIEFTRDSSDAQYLYGTRNSNNSASVTAYLATSGTWRYGRSYKYITISTGGDVIHTVTLDKNGINHDGTHENWTNILVDFKAISTLTLGSSRTATGDYSQPTFIGKIYSFKMYDNDVLILDWKPCVYSNGELCFYDSVTGEVIHRVDEVVVNEEEEIE